MKSIMSIALVAAILGIGVAISPIAAHAQTIGEYAATLNDAGAIGSDARMGMTNYMGGTDFRAGYQVENSDQVTDYRSDLDTSISFAASDYSADFSANTNYGPSSYSEDGFGSAIDYRSIDDYTNPTEMVTR